MEKTRPVITGQDKLLDHLNQNIQQFLETFPYRYSDARKPGN